jgi:hypothetical protein
MTIFLCADVHLWTWTGWTFIYTILTFLLLTVAWWQLRKNNRINEANLYYKLKGEFSNDYIKKITDGCKNKQLIIQVDTAETDIDELTKHNPYLIPSSKLHSCFLDHIEDIAFFYKEKGLIGFKAINAGFGYWILVAGNNNQIVDYINTLRKDKFYDDEIYNGFEQLYTKLRKKIPKNKRAEYRSNFEASITYLASSFFHFMPLVALRYLPKDIFFRGDKMDLRPHFPSIASLVIEMPVFRAISVYASLRLLLEKGRRP